MSESCTPELPFPSAEDDEPERWLPVPDYEDLYLVSSLGRIRSLPRNTTSGRIMKFQPHKDGVQVKRAVHIIVARAFLGPPPEGQEVRHKDGNPPNCAVTNLHYGTHRDNMLDKQEHGTDHNANKTYCPRGHEYTPENTEIKEYPNGPRRFCLKCRPINARAAYERRKAQGLPTWTPNSELTPEQLTRRREKSAERQRRYQQRLREARNQDHQ
jgi:HNH endonuclease/NUMOD4 motif